MPEINLHEKPMLLYPLHAMTKNTPIPCQHYTTVTGALSIHLGLCNKRNTQYHSNNTT
jgi:hypothetical protein